MEEQAAAQPAVGGRTLAVAVCAFGKGPQQQPTLSFCPCVLRRVRMPALHIPGDRLLCNSSDRRFMRWSCLRRSARSVGTFVCCS